MSRKPSDIKTSTANKTMEIAGGAGMGAMIGGTIGFVLEKVFHIKDAIKYSFAAGFAIGGGMGAMSQVNDDGSHIDITDAARCAGEPIVKCGKALLASSTGHIANPFDCDLAGQTKGCFAAHSFQDSPYSDAPAYSLGGQTEVYASNQAPNFSGSHA